MSGNFNKKMMFSWQVQRDTSEVSKDVAYSSVHQESDSRKKEVMEVEERGYG